MLFSDMDTVAFPFMKVNLVSYQIKWNKLITTACPFEREFSALSNTILRYSLFNQ